MTRNRKATLLFVMIGVASSFELKSFTSSSSKSPYCTLCTLKRGKTALQADLVSALSFADTFWQNSPYAAAALTCGVKASAADLVAQKRNIQKRPDEASGVEEEVDEPFGSGGKTDWRRNFAFLLYGAVYQGVAQEFLYNHVYPVLFGSGVSLRIVLTKVLFDLLVQTTLLTLPIAYMSKALIYRYSFREAFRRYFDDIKNHGLLTKYFSLWGPVQCLTFSVVPVHFRVTFIAFVSFFWLIVLSSIASRKPMVDEDEMYDECSLVDGQTCNIDG